MRNINNNNSFIYSTLNLQVMNYNIKMINRMSTETWDVVQTYGT